MSNKQFTVIHLSHTTGKSETKNVTADAFYVEQGMVMFVDNDNKALAAFPVGHVDSIESQPVAGAAHA